MGKIGFAGGKVGMEGPVGGILASELAVGSSVYLMENGTAVEYLVVNQGKPSGSSLYDDSCDGTWLLRKDIYVTKRMDATDNDYQNSEAHSYLNDTFLSLFDAATKSTIRQVKIPFVSGIGNVGTIKTGANGLATKVFLLGGYEIGYTQSISTSIPIDGAVLSYFAGTAAKDAKRIANYNGSANLWWTRSPSTHSGTTTMYWDVTKDGQTMGSGCTNLFGYRPALVLPSTAAFNKETMILKGVA